MSAKLKPDEVQRQRSMALDDETMRQLRELAQAQELSVSATLRAMIRGEHRRRAARKARQEARAVAVSGSVLSE